MKTRGSNLLACIIVILASAQVAWAEPAWQFPWPNSKDSSSDPGWEVSGNSYGCGTHDMAVGGTIDQPEKWDARAIDFGLDNGATVTAAADGIVVVDHDNTNAFGEYIIVDHTRYYTMYAHLSERLVDVGVGSSPQRTLGRMQRAILARPRLIDHINGARGDQFHH